MELENSQKQQLLLEYLISSPDVFSLCQPILRAVYFDVTLQKTVNFILKYYNNYRALPSPKQIKAETDVSLQQHNLTTDQIEYAIKEIETFCRRSAIRKAILDSVKLYEKEDYGKIEANIKEAITTSVYRRAGIGLFESIDELLERLQQQPVIPTGYTEFDYILGGGLRRREMLLFSANSGGGKSIVMANFGLNLLLNAKLKVLYLSFELPVEMIAKRYLSMLTHISQRELLERKNEISNIIKQLRSKIHNEIVIERLPVGTTPNQVRAFLREFELRRSYIPDVLILDYLDLMSPNEKVSADNVFEKDKRVSEQVHQILNDYNMIGITASQQNRSAVNAHELNHAIIAGGISKINTTDIYVSIVFNDVMRAAGEIHLEFLKTRSSDGVGKRVELKWNNTALRVENLDSTSPFTLKTKNSNNTLTQIEQSKIKLTDLLDI